jgi:hypothetical protein
MQDFTKKIAEWILDKDESMVVFNAIETRLEKIKNIETLRCQHKGV